MIPSASSGSNILGKIVTKSIRTSFERYRDTVRDDGSISPCFARRGQSQNLPSLAGQHGRDSRETVHVAERELRSGANVSVARGRADRDGLRVHELSLFPRQDR